MTPDQKRTRWLDAAEAAWAAEPKGGPSVRQIEQVAGLDKNTGSRYFAGIDDVLDRMVARATDELEGLTTPLALISCLGIATYWRAVVARPALAKLMATGLGPEGRFSFELEQCRARLAARLGRPERVEALHGLVAGEIAGRFRPSEPARLVLVEQVLAIGPGKEGE